MQNFIKTKRKYAPGKCQDCGQEKSVTTITFWMTGMKYTVCAGCIKPYRDRILTPVRSNPPPHTDKGD